PDGPQPGGQKPPAHPPLSVRRPPQLYGNRPPYGTGQEHRASPYGFAAVGGSGPNDAGKGAKRGPLRLAKGGAGSPPWPACGISEGGKASFRSAVMFRAC